ncbi:GreA/GreB family elongation factor [Vibrio renipiscarius]|uniref:Transcription elongation factor n=1 Tax=Vibrio renipiscarius TaxID=1461322 RepID=A0A0C2JWQ8_9VIBR|nr:GreA/GreB family elongation factor [Vibrio renipiscarius]KII80370.1 transcription elongation factor [Vibrio renipiscarius]KII82369.1 transcription elongation factor [Vibrio renipiscarius]
MHKQQLVIDIIAALQQKLVIAHSSTQTAIDAATDDQTVSEHKYDTLALEAAYLAHGQAMRVQECEHELSVMRNLTLRCFTDCAIAVGAYVEVEDEFEVSKHFFIAPCSGGLEVLSQQQQVYLLTVLSPLGKALKGKQEGDEVIVKIGDHSKVYQVVTVS